ncbi:MAG: magnesium transporter [Oceanococcaceae bacterium]
MSRQLEHLREAIESGRKGPVRRILASLNPAEIGGLIESLPPGEREIIWALVDPDDVGEVLLHLGEQLRAHLIETMDTDAVVSAAEGLDIDDLADFIDELPEKLTQQVLASMNEANRARVQQVLSYSYDTAGGLMNTDSVSIRPNVNVDVVLRYLRMRGELPQHTDALFVVDRYGQFLGEVKLTDLVTEAPDTTVSELMDRDTLPIPDQLSSTEVALRFEDRDLISAPVVDERNVLIGRITIDDVVDVIRDEAEHSILSQVGLDEEDDVFAPVRRSAMRRAVWLGINLLTAFIAAGVVGLFEATLEQVVALAVLMPVVASMGGIGGSQTLTLMIRGMALGQISRANAGALLRKEVAVAALNGVFWSAVVGTVVLAWFREPMLAVVMAAAMLLNQISAALTGVGLPLLLERLKVDPALAGSVVLTTVTDVVGFFAFLGLGTLILL